MKDKFYSQVKTLLSSYGFQYNSETNTWSNEQVLMQGGLHMVVNGREVKAPSQQVKIEKHIIWLYDAQTEINDEWVETEAEYRFRSFRDGELETDSVLLINYDNFRDFEQNFIYFNNK